MFSDSFKIKLDICCPLSRLMSESKILAEEGIPSVFSLVSILENPQDIHTLIRGPPSHLRLDIYSHPY